MLSLLYIPFYNVIRIILVTRSTDHVPSCTSITIVSIYRFRVDGTIFLMNQMSETRIIFKYYLSYIDNELHIYLISKVVSNYNVVILSVAHRHMLYD